MILFLLAAWGCADPEAPARCESLVSALCRHVEEQCPLADLSQEQCEAAAVGAGVTCDQAVAVSDTYEACLDGIDEAERCLVTAEGGLPADCEDAILAIE